MEHNELVNAIESIIFVAGEPVTFGDIRRVFERLWADEPEAQRDERLKALRPALKELTERWRGMGNARDFTLLEVAEGFTFRSNPRYSHVLRAMRDDRPQRLTKPALETLAIIAYRQPVTKPEVDHIRGVDSGGTLKLLLDRNMVRIVGKKEEPGRPLLYGTTKDFLSFFNLGNLTQLPSLREFHELTQESEEELRQFDGMPSLKELSDQAKKLRLEEEPAVTALEDAVEQLRSTEDNTRNALAAEGIALVPENDEPAPPAPADVSPEP